ncbi:hypothetical protein PC129_g10883 [Phytophthora cactorum]|uniref:Reverse transcriptase/retrotransposon-derived protein RNase H-like domain-containing protein n=1 Tax=Phytophthora cactorum TaxID=29920 RepID=A0A8T1I383_9STRA|nr:hypothetical protein PC119_g8918 [Phytophthora cactorum]KAG3082974.1 hypothetical protein PC122_g10729 [Phytophthora cactorum]KAG3218308.1 hypothetical protein PC129_g10883 [Phytophthora cactorum]
MRENKLYANLKKCIFYAPDIPVHGCFVSKNGVRADPEKVSSILAGSANYLHKYTKNYAGLIQPRSSLLKKDATWSWTSAHQAAFDSVKKSLAEAPILSLLDDSKPFHVVCDASNFAIGCALMQLDDDGHERVVSCHSRQMKPAERNYPVHDKKLLAMRYALIKLIVTLLGEQTCAVYTDHASLPTGMKGSYSPSGWPAGYRSSPSTTSWFTTNPARTMLSPTLCLGTPITIHVIRWVDRYRLADDLLTYNIDRFDTSRILVPNDPDLRSRIIREFYDVPLGGHFSREKTFAAVLRDFYWPHMYKWMPKWVRTCEICQSVKPSSSSQSPLRPLPVSSASHPMRTDARAFMC